MIGALALGLSVSCSTGPTQLDASSGAGGSTPPGSAPPSTGPSGTTPADPGTASDPSGSTVGDATGRGGEHGNGAPDETPASTAPPSSPPNADGSGPAAAPRSCVPDPSVFPVDISAPIDPATVTATSDVDPDRVAAMNYVAGVPDEYSGLVVLHQPERVAVAFTDHLEEHRQALHALVPHPELTLVVRGCMSEQELRRIQAEIQGEIQGAVQEAAPANGAAQPPDGGVLQSTSGDAIGGFVQVALRADGESVARELVERYGERVAVTVGVKPYPRGSTEPVGWYVDTPRGGCDAVLRTMREDHLPGLEVRVDAPDTIRSGTNFEATVEVRNDGPTTQTFEGDNPSSGYVVERGTRHIVGVFTGGVSGTGWGGSVQPGQSITAPSAYVGTADCRPDGGFALPPGEYGLLVPFLLGYDRPPSGNGITGTHIQWSSEVPITIVP